MSVRAGEASGDLPSLAGEWVAREVPPAVHGWSATQLVTLAAVVETIEPGPDAPRRAGAIAALISDTAPAADLAAVLGFLDHLDGQGHGPFRGHRFVGQPPEARVGALVAALASDEPDQAGPAERIRRAVVREAWSGASPETIARLGAIGYRPDRPAPAGDAPPVAPHAVPAGSEPLVLDADAVVVGSGAGGGVVAARLAEAGLAVVVVEAGPFLAEADAPRREGAAFSTLHLDQGTTQTADGALLVLAAATVGGGTTLGWTACAQPSPGLLAGWALRDGLDGLDGREAAADLGRLRGELGFLRSVATPPRDRLLLAGAAALGWDIVPATRNADACADCGSCGFGCPAGSKRAGIRLHLRAAAAAGARLLADAAVDRVTMTGATATGVTGTVRAVDGSRRPFTVHAAHVTIAAGALRTPGLLARSGIRHPALGARLWLSPAALLFATGRADVADGGGAHPGPWSGPTAGACSDRFAQPGGPGPHGVGPAHGGFHISSAPLHPGLLAMLLPWSGPTAHDALMRDAATTAPLLAAIAEREPGRLVMDKEGAPRIQGGAGARDAASLARGRVELARLGRAGGAGRLIAAGGPGGLAWSATDGDEAFRGFLRALAEGRPRGLLSTAPAGTVHAGADPASAACDPWGRVRRAADGSLVRGLSVADASLAPGPMGPDPAVTVMLLAARVARAILSDRGARS